jgi:hypothetical protein
MTAAAHGPGSAYRRKIWNIALGSLFFILGVIGIIIPVMPQFVFFFLSIIFFSRVSKRLRSALRRFRKKHPKIDRSYTNWRRKSRERRRTLIRKARKLKRDIAEKVDEMTGPDAGPPNEPPGRAGSAR